MSISENIVSMMESNDIINKDDRNIYAYGLRGMAMLIICTVSLLIVGFLMDEMLFTIVFYLNFLSLRAFYEGYHAHNRTTCFVLSNLVFFVCIAADKYALQSLNNVIKILIVSMICIVLNILKFNNFKEKVKHSEFKKMEHRKWIMGIVIFLVVLVIFFIVQKMDNKTISNGIFMAVICVFVLHILKNITSKKTNEIYS